MKMDYIFLSVLVSVVLIYGSFKYSKAEDNTFSKLLSEVQDLKSENLSLKKSDAEIKEKLVFYEQADKTWLSKINEMEKEIDLCQEHNFRARKSIMKLHERTIPRHVRLEPIGPIPIEIVTPSKKNADVLKKIRKQIDGFKQ
jgi:hypothetical protein